MEVRLPQVILIILILKTLDSVTINCKISKSQLDYLADGFECEIINNLQILKRNSKIQEVTGDVDGIEESDLKNLLTVRKEEKILENHPVKNESKVQNIQNLDEASQSLDVEVSPNFENEDDFERMGLDVNENVEFEVLNTTLDEVFENSTETGDFENLSNSTETLISEEELNFNSTDLLEGDEFPSNSTESDLTSNSTADYENYIENSTDLSLPIIELSFPSTFINAFITYNNTIFFVPKNIKNFFARLKLIAIVQSQLKEIHQSDLKPFTELIGLWLPYNNIESLEWHLFDFNPNLKEIILMENRIKFIQASTFGGVERLEQLDLIGNVCVDELAATFEDVEAVLVDLSEKCKLECDCEKYFVISLAVIALLCVFIVIYACLRK